MNDRDPRQEMSGMDRILADLQMASAYPTSSSGSSNSSNNHASFDSTLDLPDARTDSGQIHLHLDSTEPYVDPLQTALGELDIVYLMSLRERLLKMAMFAGLNTECNDWLQDLKKLHWNLLHKDNYASVANTIDPLDYAPETDLAALSTTSSSSSSAQHLPTGSFNVRTGVSEEGVGYFCKEAGWTFAFLVVTMAAGLIGPIFVRI